MDRLWMAEVPFSFVRWHAPKIIYADDFCQFVKEHGRAAVSRRLTYDALWFV